MLVYQRVNVFSVFLFSLLFKHQAKELPDLINATSNEAWFLSMWQPKWDEKKDTPNIIYLYSVYVYTYVCIYIFTIIIVYIYIYIYIYSNIYVYVYIHIPHRISEGTLWP
jgi:hypothetical protein